MTSSHKNVLVLNDVKVKLDIVLQCLLSHTSFLGSSRTTKSSKISATSESRVYFYLLCSLH